MDAKLAGLVSQDILAVLYLGLFIGALIMRMGKYHANTHALSMYSSLLMVAAAARLVYFVVPPSTWGQGDIPVDPDRFSKVWWTQGVNNFFYMTGNAGVIGGYLHILLMWAQAFCVIVNRPLGGRQLNITLGFAAYVLFEVALLAMYFFVPYSTVLTVSAIGNAVLLLLLAILYIFYWANIWSSLGAAARSPSLHSVLFTVPDRYAVRQATSVSEENHLRALDKLIRMTQICFVFTLGLALKLSVLLYMLFCLSKGFDESSWWAVIFIDYLFAEVITAAFVLFLLRKPVPSVLSEDGTLMPQPGAVAPPPSIAGSIAFDREHAHVQKHGGSWTPEDVRRPLITA